MTAPPMDVSRTFGEVRSLVHSEPRVETFMVLCALLERAERVDAQLVREAWMPYVTRAIEAWEPRKRSAFGVTALSLFDEEHRPCYAPLVGLLSARGYEIHARGAKRLAAATWLTGLRHINLASNRIGDAGLEALVSAPHLRKLTHLELERCGISDDGAECLARLGAFEGLEVLDLKGNRISRRGFDALRSAPWAASLQSMDMRSNHLWDSAAGLGPAGVVRPEAIVLD